MTRELWEAAGVRLGLRVRPTTVRRSIAAPLSSLARVTRARARASRARQSRVTCASRLVTSSRRGRAVVAAAVSHAAGARLGLRASRHAVRPTTVRRSIAAPLSSLARVTCVRLSASRARHSRVTRASRLVTSSRRCRGVDELARRRRAARLARCRLAWVGAWQGCGRCAVARLNIWLPASCAVAPPPVRSVRSQRL